jgi:hypothetical protein
MPVTMSPSVTWITLEPCASEVTDAVGLPLAPATWPNRKTKPGNF